MLRNCSATAWSGSPPGYRLRPGWRARPAGCTGGGWPSAPRWPAGPPPSPPRPWSPWPRGRRPAQTGPTVAQARTAAYVISRVEKALAGQHLVFRGRTRAAIGHRAAPGRTAPGTGSRSSPGATAVTPWPTGTAPTVADPSPTSRWEPPSSAGSSPASTSRTTTASGACCRRGPYRRARAPGRARSRWLPRWSRPATGRPSSTRRSPAGPRP